MEHSVSSSFFSWSFFLIVSVFFLDPQGTVSQLGVTIGLLLSQILGLPLILGTDDGWPFLLGVAFIPAILQLMLLPLCPESPRYLLISKGRLTEATCGNSSLIDPSLSLISIFLALQRLRCTSNVEDDIEEMRIEDRAQQSEARVRSESNLAI